MNYEIKQTEASFAIPRENFHKACKALRHFLEHRCYARYIDYENVIRACKEGNLPNALFYCHWKCNEEASGITGIEFNQHTLGNDYEIFCAIAKYVQDGSYIIIEDGKQNRFKWQFTSGQCIEKK